LDLLLSEKLLKVVEVQFESNRISGKVANLYSLGAKHIKKIIYRIK
jgi:hypothetical protein